MKFLKSCYGIPNSYNIQPVSTIRSINQPSRNINLCAESELFNENDYQLISVGLTKNQYCLSPEQNDLASSTISTCTTETNSGPSSGENQLENTSLLLPVNEEEDSTSNSFSNERDHVMSQKLRQSLKSKFEDINHDDDNYKYYKLRQLIKRLIEVSEINKLFITNLYEDILQLLQAYIKDIYYYSSHLLLIKAAKFSEYLNILFELIQLIPSFLQIDFDHFHQALQETFSQFLASPQYEYIKVTISLFRGVIKTFNLEQRFKAFDIIVDRDLSRIPSSFSLNFSPSVSLTSEINYGAMDFLPSNINKATDETNNAEYQKKQKKKILLCSHKKTVGRFRFHRLHGRNNLLNLQKKTTCYDYSHWMGPNGRLHVWIKAELYFPLFKILAILYETDLYTQWVPFTKSSQRIGSITLGAVIVQILNEYPWPVKQKESISYCCGIDAIEEYGSVFIVSDCIPVNTTTYLGEKIPAPSKKIPRLRNSTSFFILTPYECETATVLEMYTTMDFEVTVLRSILYPILQNAVVRFLKLFFQRIELLASNFEALEYNDHVKATPEVYELLKQRINLVLGDYFSTSAVSQEVCN